MCFAVALIMGCGGLAKAGEINPATITKIAINKVYPGLVFVAADGEKSGSPACAPAGDWQFILSMQSEDDKRLFSLLTTAYVARTPMRLIGSNSCGAFAGFEDLSQAWLR